MHGIVQFPPKNGVFFFINHSKHSIAAGVSRTDHSFGLVRSGFKNVDDALAWVEEARKHREFNRANDIDGGVARPPGASA
jgi:hypothetical protein